MADGMTDRMDPDGMDPEGIDEEQGTAAHQVRDALALAHLSLVGRVAMRLASRLPASVDRDELRSAGMLGLLDACHRFDEARSASFPSYAEMRIRGAMLDHLRAQDWLPRRLRREARELEGERRALSQRLGRRPSDGELAAALGWEEEAILAAARALGEEMVPHAVPDERADASVLAAIGVQTPPVDPLTRLGQRRLHQRIATAIERLSEKERRVVQLRYYEDLSFDEIAVTLGLTGGRVGQLHERALLQLRSRLRAVLA